MKELGSVYIVQTTFNYREEKGLYDVQGNFLGLRTWFY